MPPGPLSVRDIIHYLPNARRRSEPRSEADAHFARGSEQRSPVVGRVVSLQSLKGGFTDIAINRREVVKSTVKNAASIAGTGRNLGVRRHHCPEQKGGAPRSEPPGPTAPSP